MARQYAESSTLTDKTMNHHFKQPFGRSPALSLWALTLAACPLLPALGGVAGFTDSFEGASLDPFWTPHTESGSIGFSSSQAHSGSQSVQFNSSNTGIQKNIWLSHTFPSPQEGEFSIWFYDTGAGIDSSNYLWLQVNDLAGNDPADRVLLVGLDWDGSTYFFQSPNNQQLVDTGVPRT